MGFLTLSVVLYFIMVVQACDSGFYTNESNTCLPCDQFPGKAYQEWKNMFRLDLREIEHLEQQFLCCGWNNLTDYSSYAVCPSAVSCRGIILTSDTYIVSLTYPPECKTITCKGIRITQTSCLSLGVIVALVGLIMFMICLTGFVLYCWKLRIRLQKRSTYTLQLEDDEDEANNIPLELNEDLGVQLTSQTKLSTNPSKFKMNDGSLSYAALSLDDFD